MSKSRRDRRAFLAKEKKRTRQSDPPKVKKHRERVERRYGR